jgi:HAD superfamily hydrolase (TIGR01509 family)
MTKIKGVIFDLDGTLVDTLGIYTRAFNYGIGKFDQGNITEEELASFLNKALGLENILEELYPSLFDNIEKRLNCMAEIVDAYIKELEGGKVTLSPGAKEIMPLLKEMGLRIGVVTGRTTTGDLKWIELKRLEIADYIESMVTAADAPRKPAPDGVFICAAELGLAPAECVMVGDSQSDVATGKAAGSMTIAIPTGVAREELLSKEEPTAIINNLEELPGIIKRLNETLGEAI